MTKKLNKRGFTIVELVVVIVVIAILAAVLIPTVSSLINKANQSADIQAVRQMNEQLAIGAVGQTLTISDVYDVLNDAGMSVEDYHPLAKDTYFFWDADENRVLYTDKDYIVTYPNEYVGQQYSSDAKTWYSLSGEIRQEEVDVDNDGKVSVSSAEQLYYLSEKMPSNLTSITLTKDIDLMGANVSFEITNGKFTLAGAEQGVTITGLVSDEYKYIAKDKSSEGKIYGSGLIGQVKGQTTELVLKNITIENAIVGDLETGAVGALIGRLDKATVTIENCIVKNTIVNGKNKVGGLIGSIGDGANVTLEKCRIENTTINCSEGESAKVIGCVYSNTTKVTLTNGGYVVTNTTLNLVQGKFQREVIENANLTYTLSGKTNSTTTTIVRELDSDGKPESNSQGNPNYRMFDAKAVITVQDATISDVKYYLATQATLNGSVIIIKVFNIIQ